MDQSPPLIRVLDLRKSAAGQALLDVTELRLYAGEVSLLGGRNGSGKTTLLKILAGLVRPDRAQIWVDGRRLTWRAARAAMGREVVYLHQAPFLFDRSVGENVGYGLRKLGFRGARLRARIDEALHWAGIHHLRDRDARRLSSGEQQSVALTRARVLSPRLLLLDEPMANLDQKARDRISFLIRRLRADGLGIVVASHENRRISLLADRYLEILNGRLREDHSRKRGHARPLLNVAPSEPQRGGRSE